MASRLTDDTGGLMNEQLRAAGRNLDDVVRGAVDPIGVEVEERFGLEGGSMTSPTRMIAWLLVGVLVFGVLGWAIAACVPWS